MLKKIGEAIERAYQGDQVSYVSERAVVTS
jgi:hypothetical protein